MSKYTTTISEIVHSEMKRNGYSDFIRKDHTLKSFTDNEILEYMILKYDDDTLLSVINRNIFGGFSFSNNEIDVFFKKLFINKFWDREIKFQTLDLFRSKLLTQLLINKSWIENTYTYYTDIYFKKGTSDSDSKTNSHSETNSNTDSTNNSVTNTTSHSVTNTENNDLGRNRSATESLPQDQTSINVNDDNLQYPDSRDFTNTSNNSTGKSETNTNGNSTTNANGNVKTNSVTNGNSETITNSVNRQLDPETIGKMYRVYTIFLNDLDKALFLQIW